jgi:hypothetical protein
MCFFRDARDTLRWLGVFVHSAGNRVLFFPGFADTFEAVHGFKDASLVWNQPFNFDHFTLESDFLTWHITSARSEDHLGKPRTLDIGKDRVLWLGLSLADANVLRVVREDTQTKSDVPSSDTNRRREALVAARDSAQFPIILLNTEHSTSFQKDFLHFAFIVGPKGFEDYSGPEFDFPDKSPFLTEPFPNQLSNLPFRSHRIELSAAIDIQVTSFLLPGQLKIPVSFTSKTNQ